MQMHLLSPTVCPFNDKHKKRASHQEGAFINDARKTCNNGDCPMMPFLFGCIIPDFYQEYDYKQTRNVFMQAGEPNHDP
ncbi:hypothetical protein [Paenibacillus medicaginis]|uniref:Uncharacterized protein n=1 Tax=Paenibacillus medicaginis TaxID=1470560 RepID=A0ABV5BZM0_9BACL